MIIRKATIKDFDAIHKLLRYLEDRELEFDNNLKEACYAEEKGIEIIKKRIRSRNHITLVAENSDKEVVGMIDGTIISEIWYKEKIAELGYLAVNPKEQGKGIAKALEKEFERITYEKGAKYIKLNVFHQNKKAVALYEKLGYGLYSVYYQKKISINEGNDKNV